MVRDFDVDVVVQLLEFPTRNGVNRPFMFDLSSASKDACDDDAGYVESNLWIRYEGSEILTDL